MGRYRRSQSAAAVLPVAPALAVDVAAPVLALIAVVFAADHPAYRLAFAFR